MNQQLYIIRDMVHTPRIGCERKQDSKNNHAANRTAHLVSARQLGQRLERRALARSAQIHSAHRSAESEALITLTPCSDAVFRARSGGGAVLAVEQHLQVIDPLFHVVHTHASETHKRCNLAIHRHLKVQRGLTAVLRQVPIMRILGRR